ncbi:MAG: hypothetical protein ACI857_000078 [Arenicella sp.]|jgi:hypothetical protein
MKKALFLIAILAANVANSTDLPKICLGQYETEVPAFEFVKNDQLIKASAYDVKLVLFKDHLSYFCGSIEFTGFYDMIENSADEVNMNISVTNSISVDFDFELLLDKKSKTMKMFGLKGVPEMSIPKRQIKLTKKRNQSL